MNTSKILQRIRGKARSRKSGSGRGPKKLSRKLALVLREIGVISGDKFFKRFRPSMRSY